MTFSKYVTVVLGLVLAMAEAQDNLALNGFGTGGEIYDTANEHPLNQSQVTFPGFNFEADPASSVNASAGNWTFNVGLSIVNTDTNQTNYPLSAASDSASNVLNLAYTFDFPGGQLPSPNNTNWTLCEYILDVDWTQSVLDRASSDPGDCSVVLGASCLAQVRQGWQNPSSSAPIHCPLAPDWTQLSECQSISTNGYSFGSAAINGVFLEPDNTSSPVVGLSSGQVFSYQRSKPFNASSALTNYDEFASKLRMTVLRFAPSVNYTASHTGPYQLGEVRTFCTMAKSLGNSWRLGSISWSVMGLPILVIIWEAFSMLSF